MLQMEKKIFLFPAPKIIKNFIKANPNTILLQIFAMIIRYDSIERNFWNEIENPKPLCQKTGDVIENRKYDCE